MQKRNEFHPRPCAKCGEKVIDVRDAYTYATFPVNAEPVSQEGLVLTPHEDTRKNPFAHDAEVFVPHLPLCGLMDDAQTESDEPSSDQPDARDPEDPIPLPMMPETQEDPGPHRGTGVDGDPASLPPGGLAGEEEQEF